MKKAQARALAALAVAAVLAACHSNDDDHNAMQPPPVAETPPPPPPVSTADAFFTYVLNLISTQSDTSEPVSIEGVVVTTPENTEPQPLPAA